MWPRSRPGSCTACGPARRLPVASSSSPPTTGTASAGHRCPRLLTGWEPACLALTVLMVAVVRPVPGKQGSGDEPADSGGRRAGYGPVGGCRCRSSFHCRSGRATWVSAGAGRGAAGRTGGRPVPPHSGLVLPAGHVRPTGHGCLRPSPVDWSLVEPPGDRADALLGDATSRPGPRRAIPGRRPPRRPAHPRAGHRAVLGKGCGSRVARDGDCHPLW